ncbi:THAP domain-containing protein 3-like isoform X3 [Harmonia axyridis]|uniref:THAP domain-containing protein 3-like isoform X3 n=1 Tax=Harmonia axyridis TaxID=115357 RepID=UPI001E278B3D|nr:THAP domain-containing protein 3-like isoform X3 [Harmonia axyridis]
MVYSCVAIGCKNEQDYRRLSFHGFPFKRPHIFKLWIEAVGRGNWTPTKYSKLCSEHFLPTDYIDNSGGRSRTLEPDAVPSIFPYHKQVLPEIVDPPMKKRKVSSVDVESPPPEVKIEMDENMPGPSDESYTDTFESIVKTEPGLQEVKPQPDITASYNTKSDEVEDAEDACGYFGKYVAAELRSLPLKQRTLIKQEIQNCITHAVVGHISNLGDSESMKEENGSLSASSSNS